MLVAPVSNLNTSGLRSINNSTMNYNTRKPSCDEVSFKGKINFKEYNPAYKFCMSLFERSQLASRKRFSPPINSLKGKLKEVLIPLKNNRNIIAYNINPENTDKYILFFHGRSQNITNCQKVYEEILNEKFAVLAPEYSGFGKNKFMCVSEKTLENDIDGAIKYLENKNIKPENVGIVGHSLGGFAAVIASEKMPKAAFSVLIAPGNSISSEIDSVMKHKRNKIPKFFQYIYKRYPSIINPLKKFFKTEKRIAQSNVPVYIIHSADDDVITVKSTKSLASKAKALKELIILPSGGHRVDETKLRALRTILNKNYLPTQ